MIWNEESRQRGRTSGWCEQGESKAKARDQKWAQKRRVPLMALYWDGPGEERISELEAISVETYKTKKQREKTAGGKNGKEDPGTVGQLQKM